MFFLSIKLKNYLGTSSRVSFAKSRGSCLKSENGTNYTISLAIYFLSFDEYKGSSSASRTSIEEKSAYPTPTIMMDKGSSDPLTT